MSAARPTWPELLDLVQRTGMPQVPIRTRPLEDVNDALNDLRAGKIVGRRGTHAGRNNFPCVIAGHSPSKTGVNAPNVPAIHLLAKEMECADQVRA